MSSLIPAEEETRFRNRQSDASDMEAMQEFIDEAVVTEVLNVIKSGKEATVYRCRAHRSLGHPIVAAKVYHASGFRNFGNDAIYNDGRQILTGQVRRAIKKKTGAGREFAASMWVNREFDALSALHYAGADVPEPFFATDRAILMEYIGDEAQSAVQLQHADIDPTEAAALADRLLWNIELWLDNEFVHGDLSAFNVLYHQGRGIAIDFPQAVDPRENTKARHLLERDLRNICQYFARHGVERDWSRIAANLWGRFRYGDLGKSVGR
ncbi:MAG: RIO1 family regulatory kinase/ATPase [Chloroflexota bacterium]